VDTKNAVSGQRTPSPKGQSFCSALHDKPSCHSGKPRAFKTLSIRQLNNSHGALTTFSPLIGHVHLLSSFASSGYAMGKMVMLPSLLLH